MPLLLAVLAAIAWVIFTLVSMQTLFWLVFSKDAEAKRRRAAGVALIALAAAIVLAGARFIISFT
jgi:hypothetical protein